MVMAGMWIVCLVAQHGTRRELLKLLMWHILNGLPFCGGITLNYVLNGIENLAPPDAHRSLRPAICQWHTIALHKHLDPSNGMRRLRKPVGPIVVICSRPVIRRVGDGEHVSIRVVIGADESVE